MQMRKPVIKVLSSLLVFCSIFVGCEYEKIPGPHVPGATTYLQSAYSKNSVLTITSADWKNADYFVVPLSNLSINKSDSSEGVLNGTGTYNGTAAFGDSAKLILRSFYTSNQLYILAEWKDVNLDATGRTWLWNGPRDINKTDDSAKWTTQNNDDKLILKFKFPDSETYSYDIWEWSVALSDPLGYAIDRVSLKDQTTSNDAGTPMFVRNGMSNRSGPAYEFNGQSQTITNSHGSNALLDAGYYLYNKTEYTGNPEAGYESYKSTCKECHGERNQPSGYAGAPELNQTWMNAMSREAIKNFILDPELHEDGFSHVQPLSDNQVNNIFAWLRGQSGTPGYYLQNPSGSVADVLTTSTVKPGRIIIANPTGYKVLFVRKLNTGNPDDIVFDTRSGSTYTMDIQLCNRDSVNYIGAINQTIVFKSKGDEN